MKTYINSKTLSFNKENHKHNNANLIVEEPLEVRINGVPYVVMMRTPGHERELAAGLCFTEGMVNSFSEISSIEFCSDAVDNRQNIINVKIAGNPGKTSGRGITSRSSCGICGVRMLEDLRTTTVPVESDLTVSASDIYRMMETMYQRQEIRMATRAAHAAGLFFPLDETVIVHEDVGRHNALDKAIGHALMKGLDCKKSVATLSGRVSFEMAQKAVRAGIPIVTAVSAATSLAVEIAEHMNCTLAGIVRGEEMMVYTHPERIVLTKTT